MLMYIGGMQITPGAMIRAVANRRSAGHDADAGGEPGLLQRQRVLVVERQLAVIHRHVDDVAEPEAEQDALLHPGVDAPADRAAASGSAARTVPADSAARNSANAARAASRSAAAPDAASCSNVGFEHRLSLDSRHAYARLLTSSPRSFRRSTNLLLRFRPRRTIGSR